MPRAETSELDDRELLRRMALKDTRALELFYDRHYRVAFALVLRIVRIRQDAEDVLAEVFWQVWRQSDRYTPARGNPVAWLLTIARTRALDGLRATQRRLTSEESGTAVDEASSTRSREREEDPFVRAGTRMAVARCLEALSKEQRAPLELAYFQGMSHSEIAAAMNQPLGTMKDRIRTGMLQLRKCLKPFEARA
jgi:RNA polymerase sigma-70 factor (ECF subfamily)